MKKLINSNFENQIVLSPHSLFTLVIENHSKFYESILDLINQIENGELGNFILTEDAKTLKIDNEADILYCLFNFEINSKKITNLLNKKIQTILQYNDYFEKIIKIKSQINALINDIKFDSGLALDCSEELDINMLFKSAGMHICEKSEKLLEKLINYVDVLFELKKISVLIVVFLHNILSEDEILSLLKHCEYKEISLIAIENNNPSITLLNEKKVIIDNDLCEIIVNI